MGDEGLAELAARRRHRGERGARLRRPARDARGTARPGSRLALANKESLIAAAPLVAAVRRHAGRADRAGRLRALRDPPVPGELAGAPGYPDVRRLLLTASGGPFRGWSREQLRDVTKRRRAAHPTWSMGAKITIDSSTLMNKGLEVLEASALFGIERRASTSSCTPSRSCTRWSSTSTARCSPSSRAPTCACRSPTASDCPSDCHAWGAIDFTHALELTFEAPDREAFPAPRPRLRGGALGGAAPAWLSAANEVAVDGLPGRPDLAGARSCGGGRAGDGRLRRPTR